MLRRIAFCLSYYALLVVAFVLQHPFFMAYHSGDESASIVDYLQVIRHGLPLDLSAAGYLVIFPLLVVVLSVWLKNKLTQRIILVYTIVVFVLISVVFAVDLELYKAWQFRLDSSIFMYLDDPKNAAASLDFMLVVRQLSIGVLFFALLFIAYRKLVEVQIRHFQWTRWVSVVPLLLFSGLIFFPIRGGLSDATMNIGWAYFSERVFLNQAAVNPMWNLMDTMTQRQEEYNELYRFFSDEEKEQIMESLRPRKNAEFPRILKNNRPNVILVIMESFSANAIKALGGAPEVTPCINALCDEGLLFSNFYGSSFRTDRGVMAVLAGYPGQTKYSMMKNPSKTAHIPNVANAMKENGYDVAFYHGGDVNFTNMRSFLVNGGFSRIVCDKDFSRQEYSSRWGAADHVVLNRLLDDLHQESHEKPFFRTVLTLSSHEPFTVPMPTKFAGEDRNNLYQNSVYYTDSVIGDFVNRAKQESWWDNTLFIFVSDHSFSYPQNMDQTSPRRYQIPCLWVGGALTQKGKIETIGAQPDLITTLLPQLDIPTDEFIFGKNLLAEGQPEYAFFSYNHAFGWVEKDGFASVDLNTNKEIKVDGYATCDSCVIKGKAYLQNLFDDISTR